jgi:RimJ/RimL family protein N-acetyltransferase
MRLERTHDRELIRRVMTHPEIYPYMVSDGAAAREHFEPTLGPHLWYVAVHDGETFVGLFLCVPFNRVCWEIHTMFLPGVGLRRAIAAYRAGLAWLGANTPCRKVMGAISADNPRALAVALRAGCEKVGVLTNSISKSGRLIDQTLVAVGV